MALLSCCVYRQGSKSHFLVIEDETFQVWNSGQCYSTNESIGMLPVHYLMPAGIASWEESCVAFVDGGEDCFSASNYTLADGRPAGQGDKGLSPTNYLQSSKAIRHYTMMAEHALIV